MDNLFAIEGARIEARKRERVAELAKDEARLKGLQKEVKEFEEKVISLKLLPTRQSHLSRIIKLANKRVEL